MMGLFAFVWVIGYCFVAGMIHATRKVDMGPEATATWEVRALLRAVFFWPFMAGHFTVYSLNDVGRR